MAIGSSAPTTALNVPTTPYLVLTSVLPTTTIQLTTEATSTTFLQTTSVTQTTTEGINTSEMLTTSSFVSESTSISDSTQTSSSSSESTLLLEIDQTSQSTVIAEVTSTVDYSTSKSQLTMSPDMLSDDTERTDPWNPATTSEELSISTICRSFSLYKHTLCRQLGRRPVTHSWSDCTEGEQMKKHPFDCIQQQQTVVLSYQFRLTVFFSFQKHDRHAMEDWYKHSSIREISHCIFVITFLINNAQSLFSREHQ